MVFPTEKYDGGVSAISKWRTPGNLQIRVDFKGDLAVISVKNNLFSGYNKLVQIISRLLLFFFFFLFFFLLDTIANVKNDTNTEVTNWKLGGWGMLR